MRFGVIAELAVRRLVATDTGASARINRGSESIRIEPLKGAWLRNSGNRIVLVHGHTSYEVR